MREIKKAGQHSNGAAEKGNIGFVEILLRNGANINALDSSGLVARQVTEGQPQSFVQRLRQNGINISVENNLGETPLHKAACWGHEMLVQLLIRNGADINARSLSYGATALHKAIGSCRKELVELLLQSGIRVDEVDHLGETALHKAASRDLDKIVSLLLECGAY